MELLSNNKMPLVTNEGKTHLICFDESLKEIGEGDTKVIMYVYNATRVNYPYTKGELMTSIIRENYSQDGMEAIMNNYISGNETEELKLAREEMQLWRTKARTIAELIFNKNEE